MFNRMIKKMINIKPKYTIKKMINIKPKYTIKKMNINISENSAFSLYKKKNLII